MLVVLADMHRDVEKKLQVVVFISFLLMLLMLFLLLRARGCIFGSVHLFLPGLFLFFRLSLFVYYGLFSFFALRGKIRKKLYIPNPDE